jgi:heterokaryon incompatibility protein Het-C
MTEATERLESDVAYKALAAVAARWTEPVFTSKLTAVFGMDIPAESYRKLRKSLLAHELVPPGIELVSTGLTGHRAGYNNDRKVILLDRQMVSQAERDKTSAATLLVALLEEFGHHVDNVLRTVFSRRGGDGPRDEGAELVHALCTHWQAAPPPTSFATYIRLGHPRPLSTDAPSFRKALGRYNSLAERLSDEKAGPIQYFGAGRGHGKPGESFGHESIEDALATTFVSPDERRKIYFGNWLRDYSQAVDPKITRPSTSKNLSEGLTREALTSVIDVLARENFGDVGTFHVTPQYLGVYRPEEHIDNPHGIEDGTSKNEAFRKQWTEAEVAVDPTTGMLKYIATSGAWATSAAYIQQELLRAIEVGRTDTGRRHLGHALHTLEDFYAHSNFVELLLIRLGYLNVYPWAHKKVQARTLRYPLVTGKFGGDDINVSAAYIISENLKAVAECQAGKRSKEMKIILIVLKDIPPNQLNPKYVKKLERLLTLKENVEKKFPRIVETICRIGQLISALPKALLAAKIKDYATGVTKAQTEFLNNPSFLHPTHSQLAKDHDDHPLHVLAARLAQGPVREVGELIAKAWSQKENREAAANDVVQAALKYFVHPEDLTNSAADSRSWIFETATQWAKTNPAKLKLLEKDAIIQRQFALAEAEQKELLAQLETYGSADEILAQLRDTLQQGPVVA